MVAVFGGEDHFIPRDTPVYSYVRIVPGDCTFCRRAVEIVTLVLENGLFSAIISGIVEIIEVISSYLSNSVSFLRVGAFALAHAVLGYIIEKMSGLAPLAGGIAISIVGNAIVIVLEGMIVAIQVIRLQYYEFFSKFFNETGREFKPFAFKYNALKS